MPSRILIKLPSRERPEVLLEAASRYATMCTDKVNTRLLITLDDDDDAYIDQAFLNRLVEQPIAVTVAFGRRTTKIDAVNRDLPGDQPWDILIVASDDMWPVAEGYDELVRKHMEARYTDLDGCLWYYDGRQRRLCTMPVMGRKYFDRTGRVYEGGYKSYYADDELTEKARSCGRMAKIDLCIIKDEHPQWLGRVPEDGLYKHNRTHKPGDKAYYRQRQAAGFP